ncbi:MAG TPA: PQQ-binding-like beta-propeller repeat protein [Burkholderiaceae bacterium]|nr:PQQ-binding-like beta-propeller repeat protein [Burkholderiaceae bacterium]
MKRLRWVLLTTATAGMLALAACGSTAPAASPSLTTERTEALYVDRCAQCHDAGVPRALTRAGLREMSADRVRVALTSGVMSEQARGLTAVQIDALSRHVGRTGEVATATVANAGVCQQPSAWPADPVARAHWNGWGVDLTQKRSQTDAMAGLSAADVPRLRVKWVYGVPETGIMNAQPTVVGGRIFVGGRKVVSLDAASGCLLWEFGPDANVRTAMTVGAGSAGASTVYFGDMRANLYAVDAATGALRWRIAVESHPGARITGAPTLYQNRLYVPTSSLEEFSSLNPKYACCTFRGSVSAVDAATGKVLWKQYVIESEPKPTGTVGDVQKYGPSGASIWSSPTIDVAKRRLYVTTGNSYSDPPAPTANAIVALDLDRGAIAWARQMTANDAYTMACSGSPPGQNNCPAAGGPDVDFGSSAVLITLANGRRVLVAGQKSSVVHAVDPDRDGAVLWQTRLGRGGTLGGVQWGIAVDGRLVYAALSDVKIQRAADSTPGAQRAFGGFLRLDPTAGGGIFALDVETGKSVWQTPHPGCQDKPGCSPAQSAAVTAIPGVVFSGGLDGHLRAYDARDGHVVWDVDTAITYPATVNGVAARGGSLDGPGAVIAGGMLYAVSGYAVFGGMPGNALLAFSVDGR